MLTWYVRKDVRGKNKSQPELVCLISPDSVVPQNHPIRIIKKQVDEVLRRMIGLFDEMYANEGRPSIPPERLLKAKVLIALYSVRSENLFCEQLQYNLLFRWFLDMDLAERVFDNSTFSKNQRRLLQHAVSEVFFAAVVELARENGWVSDDHFTVDGTLIEAWASLKSFQPREQKDEQPPDDPGNPTVDFHGQKRSNQTHESKTDAEARLARKGAGKEARLSFGLHALMENRNGLYIDLKVSSATGTTEAKEALAQVRELQEIHGLQPKTVGADKGYHQKDFVSGCREIGVAPHVAEIKNRKVKGLDKRTTKKPGYQISQKIRKQVEEGFGWMKTVGGFRKTRFKGIARTQLCAHFVGAACNLVRMARLALAPPLKNAAA